MDSPINPTTPNIQPSTGFSFPVTETVTPETPLVQPPVNPAPATPTTPTTPTMPLTVPGPTAEPFGGSMPPTPIQPVQSVTQPQPPMGMFISEQKPKGRTKDIFLVGILLILLAGAVFGFTKVRSLLSGAASDGCAPTEVVEQDLTSNSMVVNFKTSEACKMQIAYGVDEILGLQMSEQIMATEHRIKLSPLMPGTPYKYQIRHDEAKYEPTRGFLTLVATASPTKAPVVVPTRNLTPVATVQPTSGVAKPSGTVTAVPTSKVTPTISSPGGTVTPSVKYTITDFQLHFGSVDPRFDTDKNGIVNIRDWQLYSK